MEYFATNQWLKENEDLFKANEDGVAVDIFLTNLVEADARIPSHLLLPFLDYAKTVVVYQEMSEAEFEALKQNLIQNSTKSF
jgi:hypothetical protein